MLIICEALPCQFFSACGSHLPGSISPGETGNGILGNNSVEAEAKFLLLFPPQIPESNANLQLYPYF